MSKKEKLSWRTVIQRSKPKAKFNPGATRAQIKVAEKKLKVQFPGELISVLLETNGIEDWFLSVDAIVKENLFLWSEEGRIDDSYEPLDDLLFFANDGTGSYFGYPIVDGKCDANLGVVYWFHETDEREVYAQELAKYFEHHLQA